MEFLFDLPFFWRLGNSDKELSSIDFSAVIKSACLKSLIMCLEINVGQSFWYVLLLIHNNSHTCDIS